MSSTDLRRLARLLVCYEAIILPLVLDMERIISDNHSGYLIQKCEKPVTYWLFRNFGGLSELVERAELIPR